MATRFTIVGLGEAVYDLFPDKQVLGGAPLNVAVHAHQLARPAGGRGVVASRVGQDELGNQLLAELRARGMSTDYVQTDPDKRTGEVFVHFDEGGGHSFEIARDAAWDWLQYDPDWFDLAQRCDGVCFGSLAQRNGQSRSTVQRFLSDSQRAVRLFDVNLRQHDYDRSILSRSCELATVVKLNREELAQLAAVLALPAPPGADEPHMDAQARALLKRYGLRMVAVTMAERGAVVYTAEGRHEEPPARYERAEGADTVGAGDAYAAGLLLGLVRRWPLTRTIRLANEMGAYVASRPGATPELPEGILKMVG